MRSKRSSKEQVNYLASVSDLMSALLFVFILTLAVAIIQARSAARTAQEEAQQARQATIELLVTQKKLGTVERRLRETANALQSLLASLETRLRSRNIDASADTVRGILRIPESAVTFKVGSAALDSINLRKVEELGEVMSEEISCFLPKGRKTPHCRQTNPDGHTLDAVLIEGHTDNQSYRGDTTERRNRILSAARANAVYEVMVLGNDDLRRMNNPKDESLFSIAGYGADRPLPGHAHKAPTNDAANRRIEFRFLLTPPSVSADESRLIHSQAK